MVGHSLLFRTSSFVVWRDRPDVFGRGLLLLVIVSLLVGLATGATGLVRELRAPSPESALEQMRAGFRQGMEQARATAEIPPEVDKQIEEYFEAGLSMGLAIAELPVRLLQPTGHILEAIGRLLSTPFEWLGGWMVYTLLVTIAAYLMGGKGSVQRMLGLTALHAAPRLLGIIPPLLGLIPVAGPTLEIFTGAAVGIGTWIWGTLIYIAATAVASEFDWARATLTVLAPVLFLTILVLVGGIAGLLVLLL